MVSRRQVNEPNTRLFGNSILRCLAHPAVQQDAARDCVLELLAVVIGGRLLQALVKRDGFTRRYIQRLGLPRLSKPGPGRGNPASRQPVELTASRLTELDLPLEWIEQRKLLAS